MSSFEGFLFSTTEYFTSHLSCSHRHIFFNVFKTFRNKENFPLSSWSSSYPLPPLNVSHFSNCRKEISSFLLTSIHLHPNPVPRIFLHPWHIEKCSCEEEYEYLQCYWKFGGATCYLGNYGRRFLSMLIKTLKDSEESLRTTLLGFKEKKKIQGPSSYKSWYLPGGGG